jgi:acyl carrier protein
MTDTSSRLVRCFRAVLSDLSEAEIREAAMTSIEAWDSLVSVTLIAVIEEEFGVQIAPEDLEQFVSFESVLKCVEKILPSDAPGRSA